MVFGFINRSTIWPTNVWISKRLPRSRMNLICICSEILDLYTLLIFQFTFDISCRESKGNVIEKYEEIVDIIYVNFVYRFVKVSLEPPKMYINCTLEPTEHFSTDAKKLTEIRCRDGDDICLWQQVNYEVREFLLVFWQEHYISFFSHPRCTPIQLRSAFRLAVKFWSPLWAPWRFAAVGSLVFSSCGRCTESPRNLKHDCRLSAIKSVWTVFALSFFLFSSCLGKCFRL